MKYILLGAEIEAIAIAAVDNVRRDGSVLLKLSDGSKYLAKASVVSRYIPKVGDYLIENADGDVTIAQKDDFEVSAAKLTADNAIGDEERPDEFKGVCKICRSSEDVELIDRRDRTGLDAYCKTHDPRRPGGLVSHHPHPDTEIVRAKPVCDVCQTDQDVGLFGEQNEMQRCRKHAPKPKQLIDGRGQVFDQKVHAHNDGVPHRDSVGNFVRREQHYQAPSMSRQFPDTGKPIEAEKEKAQ